MRPLLPRVFLAIALGGAVAPAAFAQAQCDTTYEVKAGDTVFSIAETQYGDYEKWTMIVYANLDVIQSGLLTVNAGDKLFLPCEAQDKAPDATPLKQSDAEMVLLTGSNYPPFTDKNWPGDGLITELVNAIMEETPDPLPYAIDWEDDWSVHLFPKLDSKAYDMGFPWLKPDCKADPANERCANFHFSDPLFEIQIMPFVQIGKEFAFDTDADMHGKTLCRPKGYFTHDLDANGRNWLKDGLITLVQPDTPDECFTMLAAGEVDVVAENVFLGADKIVALGLRDKVKSLERPISNEGLHVIISKKHWRGTTHLYRINAGLAALKATGRYDEIVGRHLAIFMENLKK